MLLLLLKIKILYGLSDNSFFVEIIYNSNMENKFAEAITKMRLAGNIKSEDPKVVMAIVLSVLYKTSKKMESKNPYKKYNECPQCLSDDIKKVRVKYCFSNGTNPMDCKCKNCGCKWDERD